MRVLRGFTLIEILVAIGIFALIGIAATRMLASVVDLEQRMDERAARLFAVQRAFSILDRDLTQVVPRGVRDGFGDPIAPLTTTGEGAIEFSRGGWSNPLGEARSGIQRLAYAFDGERLERRYWTVLDRAEDSEPVSQILLDDVRDFSVAFIDDDGERYENWPPERLALPGEPATDSSPPPAGESSRERPAALPLGVEVTLDVSPFGSITRIWRLPANFEPAAPPAAQEDSSAAPERSTGGSGEISAKAAAGGQATQ